MKATVNKIAVVLLAAISTCCAHAAPAPQVCPVRLDHPLRFVDVFDGSPQELATLVPDQAQEHSGYWQLGYIYKAGRFVTIRCKYDDGKELDVKLSNKVDRCDYKIDAKKRLQLSCK